MAKQLRRLSLGFLASGILACGPLAEQSSQTKIYGGIKSKTGDWLNTVAISDGHGIFCSGTAINPRLILTAAHCAKGNTEGNPARIKIYVGEGSEGGTVPSQYTAKKINLSPSYGRDPKGWNDIAYIVLDKDLTLPEASFTKVLMDKGETEELLQVNATAHLVGFGIRNDGGYGIKFETDARITQVGENEVNIGSHGHDSCQGDSGGPAFAQLKTGEWRVFGIVSRGGACGTGGVYGRMNANICWVEEDSKISLGLSPEFCAKSSEGPHRADHNGPMKLK